MCVSPSFVWLEQGPNWVKTPVPCKLCWRCKGGRVNDYVGRCLCEAAYSDWSVTLTLTYAPRYDLADKVLTPAHFQAFIRALRRRDHKLRYLAIGEYGDLKQRAHFHCVLFGQGKKLQIPFKRNTHELRAVWPHGHVWADGDADEKSFRYALKYLLHKDKADFWFSLSKQPPLGAAFFAERAQRYLDLSAFPQSFDYLPPGGDKGRSYYMSGATRRYFLKALLDGARERNKYHPERLNEWVIKSAEKVDRYEWQRMCEKYPPDFKEWLASFKSEIDQNRLSHDMLDRIQRSQERASQSAQAILAHQIEERLLHEQDEETYLDCETDCERIGWLYERGLYRANDQNAPAG